MAKQPKALKALTHGQVWIALDRLAERAGLSASGLARRAGLDPTTFNRSKRVTPDGFGINVFCLDDFDPAGIPVRQAVGAAMA